MGLAVFDGCCSCYQNVAPIGLAGFHLCSFLLPKCRRDGALAGFRLCCFCYQNVAAMGLAGISFVFLSATKMSPRWGCGWFFVCVVFCYQNVAPMWLAGFSFVFFLLSECRPAGLWLGCRIARFCDYSDICVKCATTISASCSLPLFSIYPAWLRHSGRPVRTDSSGQAYIQHNYCTNLTGVQYTYYRALQGQHR